MNRTVYMRQLSYLFYRESCQEKNVSKDDGERSCDNALTEQAVDCNTVNSFNQCGSLET